MIRSRSFLFISLVILAITGAVFLKIVIGGVGQAKQRWERSRASSSIRHALLVFPQINNGAKPLGFADLKLNEDINLASFRFYSDGEKVGLQGKSVFAEAPLWDGSAIHVVIYFDGTITEE